MWFYDPLRKAWVAEPGEFLGQVGSSARDIRVKGSLFWGNNFRSGFVRRYGLYHNR